jgi:hypothetical protein
MVSSLCLSTISGQTLRVRPVGKPVSIFPDHALTVASCRRLRLRKTIRESTDLNSGKRVRSVAQALRRLSEGAKEATAHPLAIAVSGRAGDLFDRQTALQSTATIMITTEPRRCDGHWCRWRYDLPCLVPLLIDGIGGRRRAADIRRSDERRSDQQPSASSARS